MDVEREERFVETEALGDDCGDEAKSAGRAGVCGKQEEAGSRQAEQVVCRTKALLAELGLDEAWTRKTWTDEEHKEWNSTVWEGNQQQGTEGVERKGTTETEAENLHPSQEGTLLRGILGRARLQSKSSDDETERRNE